MLTHSSRSAQRGQWSLIGTLISVAILVALAAFYLPHLLKPAAGLNGSEATALQEANGVACTEYQSQINAAVQSYRTDHDGQPPPSLADLRKYGVTDDMLHSPGCAFQLDPATGRVTNGPANPPSAAPSPASQPGPVVLGAPAPSAAPPSPGGGTRGPGGITIPNIPTAGGGM